MSFSISDTISNQLIEVIRQRGKNDLFIDRDEEREVLQFALQKGMILDQAHQILCEVCKRNDYLLESHLLEEVVQRIKSLVKSGSSISEKIFIEFVANLTEMSKGYLTLEKSQKMIIAIIEENGFLVTTGFFSDWFQKLKKRGNSFRS